MTEASIKAPITALTPDRMEVSSSYSWHQHAKKKQGFD
jgi:hypothetical protein